MEQTLSFSSKVDRKTIEKNRRNHMKALVSKLTSLVPHHSREVLALPDQLEEATNYIKKLEADLEKMKERKEGGFGRSSSSGDTIGSSRLPQIEIHEKNSVLEVILVAGLEGKLMFKEIIRVIHEEGAEVVNATFSLVDNATIFQTIHSKIGDSEPRYGAARISERLKKIVYGYQV